MADSRLPEIIRANEAEILSSWMSSQLQSLATRRDLMNEADLRRESRNLLAAVSRAASQDGVLDITSPSYAAVRHFLSSLSASRARQGFTPSETATFVFSLKEPLFNQIRKLTTDVDVLADETWAATVLLDKLGLYTAEMFQKNREELILRQQQEMMELSTPVVTLWRGILTLPLIGTLDSARTQVVMENLLQRIVETGSVIAILDITGVPIVDTLVAQHLLKTVAAARLMGTDCIISGIRPQVAQTIVHLGIELSTVTTKATLADALAVALKRLDLRVMNGNRATPAPTSVSAPARRANGAVEATEV